MPHLHLPADHTDADLVLAANLAEIVGSEDLYDVWSHQTGPGAIPEVQAELREEREQAGFFAAMSAGFVAFWRALLGRSSSPAANEDADTGAAPRPAERPYADS